MKQFLVRNLVWNKHYTNFLKDDNVNKQLITLATKFLSDLKEEERIQYCIFSVERGKRQNNSSFHFQGYIEFSRPTDALAFKNEWGLTDVQSRKGSQQQAIDYVQKERTKLLDSFFQFGVPKKQGRLLKKYNDNDPDIRNDLDYQRLLLNERLKENFYSKFEDIEKDMVLLFIKYPKWCKNLWDNYHPVKKLDIVPAQTIWICGNSGVGKTTWTNNYLKSLGYKDSDICKKKASHDLRPKLWFDLEDEKCSVLWIEEIRPNFPDHNDIIQLIDKGTRLEVKGSHIDNNFELIIFNSLYNPEFIYSDLKSVAHQIEILRRLYKGRDSKVYWMIPDDKEFNKIIDQTNQFPSVLIKH